MDFSHKMGFWENSYFLREFMKNPFYERKPLILGLKTAILRICMGMCQKRDLGKRQIVCTFNKKQKMRQ